MLCALADYFAVTTDELLGRVRKKRFAVIASQTPELGEKIKALALDYGISINAIYTTYAEARSHIQEDSAVTIILISLDNPPSEAEMNYGCTGLMQICVSCDTDRETLDGFAMYLQHMDLFYTRSEKNIHKMRYD